MTEKKKLVVLSGSGISAESGISTFRGGNGLWDNVPVEEICTPEGWYRNPAKVLEFYNKRRAQLGEVEPNDAHRIIVELEADYNVDVITQNVDNLHEKAGSTNVIHLHGEATKVRPEHGVYDDSYSEREVFDIGYEAVNLGDKAPNGSQLRPHIVFFGEAVPKIERAIDVVAEADIVLIVGTSMQVYPAAGLYRYAGPDTPIYVIDPADMPLTDRRITHIKEVATKGMEKFKKSLDE